MCVVAGLQCIQAGVVIRDEIEHDLIHFGILGTAPVVLILDDPDVFARFPFGKFIRAGADGAAVVLLRLSRFRRWSDLPSRCSGKMASKRPA